MAPKANLSPILPTHSPSSPVGTPASLFNAEIHSSKTRDRSPQRTFGDDHNGGSDHAVSLGGVVPDNTDTGPARNEGGATHGLLTSQYYEEKAGSIDLSDTRQPKRINLKAATIGV